MVHFSLLDNRACKECHGHGLRYRAQKLDGFPVFLGWVRAIAIAQKKVRKGGIGQPILILHSARSNDGADTIWHEEYRRSDLVLDVEDMKREGKALGQQVTIRAIEGGVVDLVLSDPDAQARVFAEVTAWLRGLPGNPGSARKEIAQVCSSNASALGRAAKHRNAVAG